MAGCVHVEEIPSSSVDLCYAENESIPDIIVLQEAGRVKMANKKICRSETSICCQLCWMDNENPEHE